MTKECVFFSRPPSFSWVLSPSYHKRNLLEPNTVCSVGGGAPGLAGSWGVVGTGQCTPVWMERDQLGEEFASRGGPHRGRKYQTHPCRLAGPGPAVIITAAFQALMDGEDCLRSHYGPH